MVTYVNVAVNATKKKKGKEGSIAEYIYKEL